jgi:hypothetical protein
MKGKLLLLCALFTAMTLTAGDKHLTSTDNKANGTSTEMLSAPNGQTGIPTSKQFLASLLDHFCQTHYYKCFKGREYVDGSISIESVKKISDWELKVEGRHTYLGRLGHEYRKRPFTAVILMHQGTSDTFTVTFEKQSENYLTGSISYEETTQVFRFKGE